MIRLVIIMLLLHLATSCTRNSSSREKAMKENPQGTYSSLISYDPKTGNNFWSYINLGAELDDEMLDSQVTLKLRNVSGGPIEIDYDDKKSTLLVGQSIEFRTTTMRELILRYRNMILLSFHSEQLSEFEVILQTTFTSQKIFIFQGYSSGG